MKNKKIIIFLVLILIIVLSCFIYVNDYYHEVDVSDYLKSSDGVKVQNIKEGYFFDGPGNDALIFYPGGKVSLEAYAPLMYKLALNGVDTFLVNMPFRLAVFGINKANDIIDKYDYDKYSVAGHSLGGAMIASYAYKNPSKIDNVILLGAYATDNLHDKDLNTYFIYGSNDKVMNRDKLLKSKELLKEYDEFVIEGGNHASFGCYGKQKGDGEYTLSEQEQIDMTVDKILEIIKGTD